MTPLATYATEQSATVERLRDLSNKFIGWRVDVDAVDELAYESCENDWAHGAATVWLESRDWLCAGCAITVVAGYAEPNRTFGAEVYLR
ncbi:MAG: hypothetical protein ACRDTG_18430 [Pseudonocardiaceae bacterium]